MEIIICTLFVKEVIHMVNMGEKLKSLRLEKKLTQKQVADRIGLAISAVSSYESGTRYPTYDTLAKLSYMFHVSTDYLIGVTDKRTIDVTGLDNSDIELISQLVDKLRAKN
jgi:transcriptional regulator with XRE-family HTH domain